MTVLYTDPVHLAPTDPALIAGPDGSWWMFYTQRRAHEPAGGVTWVHGTDIGVARSLDGGRSWQYDGVVAGLDPHPGRNTLWAPEIVRAGDRYHMFTSYIPGVPDRWEGHPRTILHHSSADLVEWQYDGVLPLSSDRVIDACAFELPRGGWRLWYKDEAAGSTTWSVDSPDLVSWSEPVQVIDGAPHEGPNVFRLDGFYWMITDEWRGLAVHRSTDLTTWEPAGHILDERPYGHHADVVTCRDPDGNAVGWIFYFTHRTDRLTDVHVAVLRASGNRLVCDRDAPVALDLRQTI
ncbi:family 43 glycosylhydrolase [Kribbella speibonae]|uniref:Glycosyl hydrolase n=1 Tax=Kribbella speibonae TaxID=1572660 RepID=A0A4R0IUA3_9ACTN|nr:family 43 glycosylhydrolase [Kribbella speibonae]TCC27064.1 glycosyl hydrolase [Kribbella speibonae]TCC36084.1 glycosyl hydrolase [Kribbella speibonae]